MATGGLAVVRLVIQWSGLALTGSERGSKVRDAVSAARVIAGQATGKR